MFKLFFVISTGFKHEKKILKIQPFLIFFLRNLFTYLSDKNMPRETQISLFFAN